jgi:hypothetical protein
MLYQYIWWCAYILHAQIEWCGYTRRVNNHTEHKGNWRLCSNYMHTCVHEGVPQACTFTITHMCKLPYQSNKCLLYTYELELHVIFTVFAWMEHSLLCTCMYWNSTCCGHLTTICPPWLWFSYIKFYICRIYLIWIFSYTHKTCITC